MYEYGDDDTVGVLTEIKIGVSTGKSIPPRVKFSSLSSKVGILESRKTGGSLTDRHKVSKSDEILRVLRHCWRGQDNFQ